MIDQTGEGDSMLTLWQIQAVFAGGIASEYAIETNGDPIFAGDPDFREAISSFTRKNMRP